MSFIDMMADYDWSERDIRSRTEAMIASQFPQIDFQILERKLQGTQFGYVLTPEEQADLARYQAVAYQAGAEADAARLDMALLRKVFAYEAAVRDNPEAPPPAEAEVLNLYNLRNPTEQP